MSSSYVCLVKDVCGVHNGGMKGEHDQTWKVRTNWGGGNQNFNNYLYKDVEQE